MPRVMCFYDANGGEHFNHGRPRAPYGLMVKIGDYFEIDSRDCVAGNLIGLTSMYTARLGRRFQFRTLDLPNGHPVYRVTLVSLDLSVPEARKVQNSVRSSGVFVVKEAYTKDGRWYANTWEDERGRLMMYPLGLMNVGDYFFVQGCKSRRMSACKVAEEYGLKKGARFRAEDAGKARIKIVRIS